MRTGSKDRSRTRKDFPPGTMERGPTLAPDDTRLQNESRSHSFGWEVPGESIDAHLKPNYLDWDLETRQRSLRKLSMEQETNVKKARQALDVALDAERKARKSTTLFAEQLDAEVRRVEEQLSLICCKEAERRRLCDLSSREVARLKGSGAGYETQLAAARKIRDAKLFDLEEILAEREEAMAQNDIAKRALSMISSSSATLSERGRLRALRTPPGRSRALPGGGGGRGPGSAAAKHGPSIGRRIQTNTRTSKKKGHHDSFDTSLADFFGVDFDSVSSGSTVGGSACCLYCVVPSLDTLALTTFCRLDADRGARRRDEASK